MKWSKNVKINGVSEKLYNVASLLKEVSEKLPGLVSNSDEIKRTEKAIAREAYNLKPKDVK